jgi:hypothetical protein
MHRVSRLSAHASALAIRSRTGSSTSGRVVAVHNGLEGRVQLTDFRALDPKCTRHPIPVADALCAWCEAKAATDQV